MPKEQVDLQMDLDNEPEVEFIFEEEVVEETPNEETVTVEDNQEGSQVNVEALKAEIEALKASLSQPVQNTNNAQESLITALLTKLSGKDKEDQSSIDLEAFKKNYFVDPAKTTDTLIDLKTQKFNEMLEKMEKKYSRIEQKIKVISDAGTRSVFEKYSNEVESLVDSGQSYENALLMTKAKHLDEFTKEAVDKALAEAADRAKPRVEVPFTNSNIPSAPRQPKQKVITVKEQRVMQEIAENSGGIYSMAEDKEFLYNYAKKRGLI